MVRMIERNSKYYKCWRDFSDFLWSYHFFFSCTMLYLLSESISVELKKRNFYVDTFFHFCYFYLFYFLNFHWKLILICNKCVFSLNLILFIFNFENQRFFFILIWFCVNKCHVIHITYTSFKLICALKFFFVTFVCLFILLLLLMLLLKQQLLEYRADFFVSNL